MAVAINVIDGAEQGKTQAKKLKSNNSRKNVEVFVVRYEVVLNALFLNILDINLFTVSE